LTIPDQPQSAASGDDEATDELDEEAVVDTARPTAELFRPAYDAAAASEEVARRGLPTDVYRAATIRTGRLIT
jgi:hypothetical protein